MSIRALLLPLAAFATLAFLQGMASPAVAHDGSHAATPDCFQNHAEWECGPNDGIPPGGSGNGEDDPDCAQVPVNPDCWLGGGGGRSPYHLRHWVP